MSRSDRPIEYLQRNENHLDIDSRGMDFHIRIVRNHCYRMIVKYRMDRTESYIVRCERDTILHELAKRRIKMG